MNQKTNKSLKVILAKENDQKINTKSSAGANKRRHPKKWDGLQYGNVEGIKQTEDNATYGLRQKFNKIRTPPVDRYNIERIEDIAFDTRADLTYKTPRQGLSTNKEKDAPI